MLTIQNWLDKYGESHQNATNKLIHWVCVPTIMFTILGLLYSIPLPGKSLLFNGATIFYAITLLFYLRLSIPMFLGFLIIGGAMIWGNHLLAQHVNLPIFSIVVFVVAWIGQFIGHKIEGKKPSFFDDLQFLLIGPAWLLSFIYKKIGVNY